MIKPQKLRIANSMKSIPTTAPVTAVVIIAFSTLLVVFAGPTSTITAYAEQTYIINATKIVNASKDKV